MVIEAYNPEAVPFEKPDFSKKDYWALTLCKFCLHGCSVRVHVKNGVVVKIEPHGNVDNLGKNCPKALGGIMRLYDSSRIKAPLKRTNPEKGIGVDPKWVEISWEEALDTVGKKLKEIRQDDPRRLVVARGDFHRIAFWIWPAAFGSPHFIPSSGHYCGAAYHPINAIIDGTFAVYNDYERCNYWLQIGSGMGFSSHLHLAGALKRMADARARGMKLVVVDPQLSVAASKADEWIPIRPGTDRAFILAMMHVLLHELKVYDGQFLKHQTNAPYLVGGDGNFVREKESGKPMIWDPLDNRARVFDDPTIQDIALEGAYMAEGTEGRPGLQMLKDAVKEYTPEWASQVTTIPAKTTRRIAAELAQEAMIGSTIEIEGKQYPYRPAGAYGYRGLAGHMDGGLNIMALRMLNMLVGSLNVPGGHFGVPLYPGVPLWFSPVLHPTYGYWIKPGPDGTVLPMATHYKPPVPFSFPPNSIQLIEWFPIAVSSNLGLLSIFDPEKFHLPTVPDTLILWHTNPMVTAVDTAQMEQVLRKMEFIISINIHHDESTEFADIILPDRTYFERPVVWPFGESPYVAGWQYAQAVVKPLYNTMDATDVLVELADRAGFLPELNSMLNFSMMGITPPYDLKLDRKYTAEEIWDRYLKSACGEEYGVDWFSRHGSMSRRWKAEEIFCPNDTAAGHTRYPFYFEWIKKQGEELQQNLRANGVDWWDTSNYLPLPVWKTTILHKEPSEYDMYAIMWKTAFLNNAENVDVPWIAEIGLLDPHNGSLLMNTETARAKGIRDGDLISVKSPHGEIRGPVRLTEGIHPEVIGIPNTVQRYSEQNSFIRERMPKEKKGCNINRLLKAGLDYIDNLTSATEETARVKVAKVQSL